ncbi:MAG: hypothetical protein Q8Q60_02495 [Candidatus Chromulinivorax sp.]|nr:hypothetical protein [Candidatus Chromulinivorax sp.]
MKRSLYLTTAIILALPLTNIHASTKKLQPCMKGSQAKKRDQQITSTPGYSTFMQGYHKLTDSIVERDAFTSSPDCIMRAQGVFIMAYGTGQMMTEDSYKFITKHPDQAVIATIALPILLYIATHNIKF